MNTQEDGDAVVAVGHVGGHAFLQEDTESINHNIYFFTYLKQGLLRSCVD